MKQLKEFLIKNKITKQNSGCLTGDYILPDSKGRINPGDLKPGDMFCIQWYSGAKTFQGYGIFKEKYTYKNEYGDSQTDLGCWCCVYGDGSTGIYKPGYDKWYTENRRPTKVEKNLCYLGCTNNDILPVTPAQAEQLEKIYNEYVL